jgi:hypothetical protein
MIKLNDKSSSGSKVNGLAGPHASCRDPRNDGRSQVLDATTRSDRYSMNHIQPGDTP